MSTLTERSGRLAIRASTRPIRLAAGPPGQLEPLEPRKLLVAYTFQPLADTIDLPGTLHEFMGPAGADYANFGSAAAALGDIDGDGFGDFAISAPGRAANGGPMVSGAVLIYSGRTASLIRELRDGFEGFGSALANVGDVDGDGVPDLLVGSPRFAAGEGPAEGRAVVYSGASGAIIHAFFGEASGAEMGHAVAGLQDVDGDGVPDLLVTAPGGGPGGGGRATVYSGATGEQIHTWTGPNPGARFGTAAAATHPVGESAPPGSGAAWVYIGAPGAEVAGNPPGAVYAFDAVTGAQLSELAAWADGAGAMLAYADGVLYVGAAGNVHLVGNLLEGPPDLDIVVNFMAIAGDLNGDGRPEVVLRGANFLEVRYGGYPHLAVPLPESLADGVTLIVPAGDVDGDGFVDVLAIFDATGQVRVVSSLAIFPPVIVSQASSDLRHLISWTAPPPQTPGFYVNDVFLGRTFFLVSDGRVIAFDDVPGVGPGNTILAMNGSGLIVGAIGRPAQGHLPASFGPLFLVRDGVRTMLADAVTQVVGGVEPAFERFRVVKVGEDGSILFNDPGTHTGSPPAAWLFRDGVLTHLWQGGATDMNAAGQIVGNRTLGGSHPVLRNTDGGLVLLTGLTRAEAVNNAGVVVGFIQEAPGDQITLAIWRAGAILTTATVPRAAASGSTAFDAPGLVRVSDRGDVLFTLRSSGPFTHTSTYELHRTFLYTPEDGLQRIVESGGWWPNFQLRPRAHTGLALGEDRRIITTHGVYAAEASADPWFVEAGAPVWSYAGENGIAIGTRTTSGDAVLLRGVDGSWSGLRLGGVHDTAGVELAITRVLPYEDAATDRQYVFVLAGGRMFWGEVAPDGQTTYVREHPGFGGEGATPVVAHATLYRTQDGRAVLAGTNAAGEFVLYFQNGEHAPDDPRSWSFDNLTLRHFAPQGIAPASDLTHFGSRWAAEHLAYLDAAGNVHAVWWAPGAVWWGATDLTAAAGAPLLAGRLSAFVTRWDTMHVTGADAQGRVWAVWWAPDFGGAWRADLLADPGDLRLDPASPTAFMTAWDALNVAGIDPDSGRAVVYWWTPLTGGWIVQTLDVAGQTELPALAGGLAGVATGDGMSLVGTTVGDRLVRLFWGAEAGTLWSFEEITPLG